MNWTSILRNGGIPEPPGRAEVVEAVNAATAKRKADQAAALRDKLGRR